MARDNGKPAKRVISVGPIPKRLRGSTIYVDIRAGADGIDVEVASKEPFRHRYRGDVITRFAKRAQFLEYSVHLNKTPIKLNHYINDLYRKFMGISNFLVTLAKKNDAKIYSRGSFMKMETLCGGLEKILRRAKPHLGD